MKQPLHGQFLPATSTGYTNIFAKVVDDPDVLFQVRYEGTLTSANIGRNCTVTYAAGSTTTGNSLAYATGMATTATLPFRIVDIVGSSTDVNGAAVTDIIVKYNVGTHAYNLATGQ